MIKYDVKDKIEVNVGKNNKVVINENEGLRMMANYELIDDKEKLVYFNFCDEHLVSFYDNQVWVSSHERKINIYNVLTKQELSVDNLVDVYETNRINNESPCLCLIKEINDSEIEDTIGIIVNSKTLEPLFLYSVARKKCISVYSQEKASLILGHIANNTERLEVTIKEEYQNKNIISNQPISKRYEELERILKKKNYHQK